MDKKQKILIVGGGGREHAVGWRVFQSPKVEKIYFAPGNAGTAKIGENLSLKATDINALKNFALKEKIDFTLALPDDPLALGIVDEFKKDSLRIFGPVKAAAKLESSKSYAKKFMKKYNLPTASFEVFSDAEKAKKYLENHSLPVVVKVSGLALGKGVFICHTLKEAQEAVEKILVQKTFGDSGNEIVIEEFLFGQEISIHVFSDGKNYSVFPSSQDHKKAKEGDIGPNTGGMGTIAPLPFLTEENMKDIEERIVKPTLFGIQKEGAPFVGILYPGLIMTDKGPKILEFNARFGDPETQTYMRLLETDILDILNACTDGTLGEIEIKWKKDSACTIVLASGGYPGEYEKGKVINGIEEAENDSRIKVFHAGTVKNEKEELVTNGGRVLGVSAVGNDLNEALKTAYEAVEKISFEGMQYRKDIGAKAMASQTCNVTQEGGSFCAPA